MINEDIDPLNTEEIEPLTTVIGIKCNNGLIIATDSQATAKTKRTKDLRAEKILQINKFSALGGSGDSDHVKKLAYALKQQLGEKILNGKKMEDVLESVLEMLYQKYNVQKSKSMGFAETKIIFHPQSIFGTKLLDGFGLYILKDDGWVSHVDNYAAIGSGSDLARLILDMQSRGPTFGNKILADLPIRLNFFNACVAINEVKNFDSQSGGDTRVAVIKWNGFQMMPNNVVQETYEGNVERISTLLSKGSTDKNAKEMFKHYFKR